MLTAENGDERIIKVVCNISCMINWGNREEEDKREKKMHPCKYGMKKRNDVKKQQQRCHKT